MGSSSPEKLKETQSERARTPGLHVQLKLSLGGKNCPTESQRLTLPKVTSSMECALISVFRFFLLNR